MLKFGPYSRKRWWIDVKRVERPYRVSASSTRQLVKRSFQVTRATSHFTIDTSQVEFII